MFGRKKNIENGDYKRLIKALKKSLNDNKKAEALISLLGYDANEIKSDYDDLIKKIKLEDSIEYAAGWEAREEERKFERSLGMGYPMCDPKGRLGCFKDDD
ncbi:hypothetical protein [Ruminococcus flavefaciens]|uniref:hypothetical protein n=1 Tax=Ruminococcus flavefaciens TaxID=1265 RepID=UPI00048EF3A1|nr:hypothetical protein [Ruminococcus flavefaciens]